MKTTVLTLSLLCWGFIISVAAQEQKVDFLKQDSWYYNEYGTGNVYEDVQKRYVLNFRDEKTGYLNISLVYPMEGEGPITFIARLAFDYVISEKEDEENGFILDVKYSKLSFKPIANNYLKRESQYFERIDRVLIDELMTQLSGNEFSYELSHSGSFLILKEFEQNTQSDFTYFTSNPIDDDKY